jgi:hypothetical protein
MEAELNKDLKPVLAWMEKLSSRARAETTVEVAVSLSVGSGNCSIGTGILGFPYYIWRCAQHGTVTSEELSLARDCILAAERSENSLSYNTFGNPHSVIYGDSGLPFLRLLTAEMLGISFSDSLERLEVNMRGSQSSLDLTLGRAGFLTSLLILLEQPPNSRIPVARLETLATQVLQDLVEGLERCGVIISGCGVDMLGAAHGWAGILYSVMRGCRKLHIPLPPIILAQLIQLSSILSRTDPSGQWPISLSRGGSSHCGWCNGAAGLVYLWLEAFRTTQDKKWMVLASSTGVHAARSPRNYSLFLCCGIPGQVYSLLALYRETHRRSLWERAVELAYFAAMAADHQPMDNLNFLKGRLGICMLVTDLCTAAEIARMPFIEA